MCGLLEAITETIYASDKTTQPRNMMSEKLESKLGQRYLSSNVANY